MKGSWPIKAVLSTIAPHLDYLQLDGMQNGTLAKLAYLNIINPETDPTEREQNIRNLLRYCELDTRAMVEGMNPDTYFLMPVQSDFAFASCQSKLAINFKRSRGVSWGLCKKLIPVLIYWQSNQKC